MPETCQEAAIYFDPNNTKEMAEKIKFLFENPTVYQEFSSNGRKRVEKLFAQDEQMNKLEAYLKDTKKDSLHSE
mgnify:CR=1 FL=1